MTLRFVSEKSGRVLELAQHAHYKVKAQPHEVYALVDIETGLSPQDIAVNRSGNDLILSSKEADVRVVVENFWKNCETGEDQCYAVLNVLAEDGTMGMATITQDGPVLEHLVAGQTGTLSADKGMGAIFWLGATALMLEAVSLATSGNGSDQGHHTARLNENDRPIISFTEDTNKDWILSKEEIGEDKQTPIHISFPNMGDYKSGDKLTLTINGKQVDRDGKESTETITLTEDDIKNGINVNTTISEDKPIKVEAEVAEGNGSSTKETVKSTLQVEVDTQAPNDSSAMITDIKVAKDNQISLEEAKAEKTTVTGKIVKPGTSEVAQGEFTEGDEVVVTLKGKSNTGKINADGTFSVEVNTNDLLDAKKIDKIEVKATDTAGNKGSLTKTDVTFTIDRDPELDRMPGDTNGDGKVDNNDERGKPQISFPDDANQDNMLNKMEVGDDNKTTVKITFPTEGNYKVGDEVVLKINDKQVNDNNQEVTTAIKLTDQYLKKGITVEVPVNKNGNGANEQLKVEVSVTNPANHNSQASPTTVNKSVEVNTQAPEITDVKISQEDNKNPADNSAEKTVITFTGNNPDATYTVESPDGKKITATLVKDNNSQDGKGDDGKYHFKVEFNPALKAGDKITVTGIDKAGNEGKASGEYVVPADITHTGDHTPPSDSTAIISDIKVAGNNQLTEDDKKAETQTVTGKVVQPNKTDEIAIGEFTQGDKVVVTVNGKPYDGVMNADGTFKVEVKTEDLLAKISSGSTSAPTGKPEEGVQGDAPANPIKTDSGVIDKIEITAKDLAGNQGTLTKENIAFNIERDPEFDRMPGDTNGDGKVDNQDNQDALPQISFPEDKNNDKTLNKTEIGEDKKTAITVTFPADGNYKEGDKVVLKIDGKQMDDEGNQTTQNPIILTKQHLTGGISVEIPITEDKPIHVEVEVTNPNNTESVKNPTKASGQVTVKTQPVTITDVSIEQQDTSTTADNQADQTVVRFKGSDPKATYTVTGPNGEKGEVKPVEGKDGEYIVTFKPALTSGGKISITGVDEVGNVGEADGDHLVVPTEIKHVSDTTPPSNSTVTITDIKVGGEDNQISLEEAKAEKNTVTGKLVKPNTTEVAEGEFSEGDKVTITVNGKDFTSTLHKDGTFSVEVDTSSLLGNHSSSNPSDQGEGANASNDLAKNQRLGVIEKITVEAKDLAGNTGTVTKENISFTIEKDMNMERMPGDINGDGKIDDKDESGKPQISFPDDTNHDNMLNKAEVGENNKATVKVTFPKEGNYKAGDEVVLKINGQQVDESNNNANTPIKLTEQQLTDGIVVEVPVNNSKGGNGETDSAKNENEPLKVEVSVTNPANESSQKTPTIVEKTVTVDTRAVEITNVKIVQEDTSNPADNIAEKTVVTFTGDDQNAIYKVIGSNDKEATVTKLNSENGSNEVNGKYQYQAEFSTALSANDKVTITGTDKAGNEGKAEGNVPVDIIHTGDKEAPSDKTAMITDVKVAGNNQLTEEDKKSETQTVTGKVVKSDNSDEVAIGEFTQGDKVMVTVNNNIYEGVMDENGTFSVEVKTADLLAKKGGEDGASTSDPSTGGIENGVQGDAPSKNDSGLIDKVEIKAKDMAGNEGSLTKENIHFTIERDANLDRIPGDVNKDGKIDDENDKSGLPQISFSEDTNNDKMLNKAEVGDDNKATVKITFPKEGHYETGDEVVLKIGGNQVGRDGNPSSDKIKLESKDITDGLSMQTSVSDGMPLKVCVEVTNPKNTTSISSPAKAEVEVQVDLSAPKVEIKKIEQQDTNTQADMTPEQTVVMFTGDDLKATYTVKGANGETAKVTQVDKDGKVLPQKGGDAQGENEVNPSNTPTGADNLSYWKAVFDTPLNAKEMVTVTGKDTAGNEAQTDIEVPVEIVHPMDTTAPDKNTVEITEVKVAGDDNIVQQSELKEDMLTVTGKLTKPVKNGGNKGEMAKWEFTTDDEVTVTVNGNRYTGQMREDGTFEVNVKSSDLKADKNCTIDKIEVKAKDLAGNVGSITKIDHKYTIEPLATKVTKFIMKDNFTDDFGNNTEPHNYLKENPNTAKEYYPNKSKNGYVGEVGNMANIGGQANNLKEGLTNDPRPTLTIELDHPLASTQQLKLYRHSYEFNEKNKTEELNLNAEVGKQSFTFKEAGLPQTTFSGQNYQYEVKLITDGGEPESLKTHNFKLLTEAEGLDVRFDFRTGKMMVIQGATTSPEFNVLNIKYKNSEQDNSWFEYPNQVLTKTTYTEKVPKVDEHGLTVLDAKGNIQWENKQMNAYEVVVKDWQRYHAESFKFDLVDAAGNVYSVGNFMSLRNLFVSMNLNEGPISENEKYYDAGTVQMVDTIEDNMPNLPEHSQKQGSKEDGALHFTNGNDVLMIGVTGYYGNNPLTWVEAQNGTISGQRTTGLNKIDENIVIDTGDGDDLIRVGGEFLSGTLKMGNGDDKLLISKNFGYINADQHDSGNYNAIVDMGEGDNVVHIMGGTPQPLIVPTYPNNYMYERKISFGSGDDTLRINGTVFGATYKNTATNKWEYTDVFDMGDGNNLVDIGQIINGKIKGGKDADYVFVSNLGSSDGVPKVEIDLGDGNNLFKTKGFFASAEGRFHITTGSGDDKFFVNSIYGTTSLGNNPNKVNFKTGAGNDYMEVDSISGGIVTNIYMDEGNDTLYLKKVANNNTTTSQVNVQMGDGDDHVYLGEVSLPATRQPVSLTIDGGKGNDTLHLTADNQQYNTSHFLNFDHIKLEGKSQTLTVKLNDLKMDRWSNPESDTNSTRDKIHFKDEIHKIYITSDSSADNKVMLSGGIGMNKTWQKTNDPSKAPGDLVMEVNGVKYDVYQGYEKGASVDEYVYIQQGIQII